MTRPAAIVAALFPREAAPTPKMMDPIHAPFWAAVIRIARSGEDRLMQAILACAAALLATMAIGILAARAAGRM